MQQALGYAKILDIPVAFSSNGDGFLQHDLSGFTPKIERELSLDAFLPLTNSGRYIRSIRILQRLNRKRSLLSTTFLTDRDVRPVTISK